MSGAGPDATSGAGATSGGGGGNGNPTSGSGNANGVNVVGDIVQHVASGSETSCELSALGCSKENIDINILSPSRVPVSYR